MDLLTLPATMVRDHRTKQGASYVYELSYLSRIVNVDIVTTTSTELTLDHISVTTRIHGKYTKPCVKLSTRTLMVIRCMQGSKKVSSHIVVCVLRTSEALVTLVATHLRWQY